MTAEPELSLDQIHSNSGRGCSSSVGGGSVGSGELNLDDLCDNNNNDDEDQVYQALDSLGTDATHRGQSTYASSSMGASFGASMDFGDSFACVDEDDDDYEDLTATAAQFTKLDSEKAKSSKEKALRTASRQPALQLIGEDDEEEEDEEEESQ